MSRQLEILQRETGLKGMYNVMNNLGFSIGHFWSNYLWFIGLAKVPSMVIRNIRKTDKTFRPTLPSPPEEK